MSEKVVPQVDPEDQIAPGSEDNQTTTDVSREKEHLGPGDGENAKASKGLLNVPSRSSSQRNQSSPTSTGLSGQTASESRNSIGARSKESKNSILGRHRNGSLSSRRSAAAETEPANAANDSQPTSPVNPVPKKKRGGLLSLLGCCGVPDNANTLEGNDEGVHKLDKLPARATNSKSRQPTPQDQSSGNKSRILERQPQPEHPMTSAEQDEEGVSGGVHDNVEESSPPKQAGVASSGAAPVITVQGSNGDKSQTVPPTGAERNNEDRDQIMPDATVEEPDAKATLQKDSQADDIPSPPQQTSNPVIGVVADSTGSSAPDNQKFLLPPIAPEFKGKKCLVLDLDETLVHSSFKILHQADFTIPVEIEGNYHNVYVIKRPGVDQFMKRVGELYEVVVFTASVSKYGDPLLDQLDIHKVVHHRLFRESCYNHQGNYVKDLSQVGRDLKDTIIIDNSPTSYIFHPQHAVPISSWFSDAHDNELLDLIPVLEDLAAANVQDVSLVLDVTL